MLSPHVLHDTYIVCIWSWSVWFLSGHYLFVTWSLSRPYMDPTWSDWYFHGPYVASILSLCCLHMFCMFPTWSVSCPSLSGPYLVTTWSLHGPSLGPRVDPAWSDWYYMAPTLSLLGPYVVCTCSAWSLHILYLVLFCLVPPGHFLVTIWALPGLWQDPTWTLPGLTGP